MNRDERRKRKRDGEQSAREARSCPPFHRGDLVCRIGFSGIWVVTEVVLLRGKWIVGVGGQRNGWPEWPASEFALVPVPAVAFCVSA